MNQTALDGSFELDSGGLSQARLGTRAPTELAMWGGTSVASSLCGQFQQLAFIAEPVFKCGLCDPAELPIETFCDLPNAEPYLEANVCVALELGEERPRCEQPWPERHRPFDRR